MRRHLNRLGLSLLFTLGVVAWNQQQTHSFSQPRVQLSGDPEMINLIQIIEAAQ